MVSAQFYPNNSVLWFIRQPQMVIPKWYQPTNMNQVLYEISATF